MRKCQSDYDERGKMSGDIEIDESLFTHKDRMIVYNEAVIRHVDAVRRLH